MICPEREPPTKNPNRSSRCGRWPLASLATCDTATAVSYATNLRVVRYNLIQPTGPISSHSLRGPLGGRPSISEQSLASKFISKPPIGHSAVFGVLMWSLAAWTRDVTSLMPLWFSHSHKVMQWRKPKVPKLMNESSPHSNITNSSTTTRLHQMVSRNIESI